MQWRTRFHLDRSTGVNSQTRLLGAPLFERGGRSTRRKGFSLNEVLIAIFVMAVGLVGVFSLFPIGLLNVSRAVDMSESVYVGRSALADMRVRGLFDPDRYRIGVNVPNDPTLSADFAPNNPFIKDWAGYNPENRTLDASTFLRRYPGQPGLPVCIDPEWLHHAWEENEDAGRAQFDTINGSQRLGRSSLDASSNPYPLGWGMQRVMPTDGINTFYAGFPDTDIDSSWAGTTRYWPDWPEYYLNDGLVHNIFSSQSGLVFREDLPSIPEIDHHGTGKRQHKYTWMVTAQLLDAGDEYNYHVSVVTFANRDLYGEQVVGAIYLTDPISGGPSNKIILDWPYGVGVDFEVPRNGWLLDATYPDPYHRDSYKYKARAHWYRIIDPGELKRVITTFDGRREVRNRRLVTVDRPLVAVTRFHTDPNEKVNWGDEGNVWNGIDDDNDGEIDELDGVNVTASEINVAVIIPGVVNVVERMVRVR